MQTKAEIRELVKELSVAADMLGYELRGETAVAMASELVLHPFDAVMKAVHVCRRGLPGRARMQVNDILERLPGGHPSGLEAWACCPKTEAETVCWTRQTERAFGKAAQKWNDGLRSQAQGVFLDAYAKAVEEADGPPVWVINQGHDRAGRDAVLLEAVADGRISVEHAQNINYMLAIPKRVKALPGQEKQGPGLAKAVFALPDRAITQEGNGSNQISDSSIPQKGNTDNLIDSGAGS